jgi:hypothetical protein
MWLSVPIRHPQQARIRGRPLSFVKNIWNWPWNFGTWKTSLKLTVNFKVKRPLFPHTLDPPLHDGRYYVIRKIFTENWVWTLYCNETFNSL